jgi:hypothetical protein
MMVGKGEVSDTQEEGDTYWIDTLKKVRDDFIQNTHILLSKLGPLQLGQS